MTETLIPVRNAKNLHPQTQIIDPPVYRVTQNRARFMVFSLITTGLGILWVYAFITTFTKFLNILTIPNQLGDVTSYKTVNETTLSYIYQQPQFASNTWMLIIITVTLTAYLIFLQVSVTGTPLIPVILLPVMLTASSLTGVWVVSSQPVQETVIHQIVEKNSDIQMGKQTITPEETVTEYAVTPPTTNQALLYTVTVTTPSSPDNQVTVTVQTPTAD